MFSTICFSVDWLVLGTFYSHCDQSLCLVLPHVGPHDDMFLVPLCHPFLFIQILMIAGGWSEVSDDRKTQMG